jgi:hypothetical protein
MIPRISADYLLDDGEAEAQKAEQDAASVRFESFLDHWRDHPADFVCEVLGAQPDPWQCDVMDALLEEDNIAVRACHGVGKTSLASWIVIWYMFTHRHAVVPTTAPTYNKQVRDVLWGTGIHKWYERAQEINPWLTNFFELTTTRMHHTRHAATWFAVGIASGTPINVEGYHAENLLAVFDEAKGIHKATWESIEGMRTTQRAKLLVMSTPGGKIGEFFKVFTEYKTTWPVNFVIHPECLRETLHRQEAKPYSHGGTYYSDRVRSVWVERMGIQWGKDSAAYIARCIGDFPDLADMNLIPYEWLSRARHRKEGSEGETWVSCDVARSGRDRTVILVGKGGTLLAGETISRNPDESTALEARLAGIGKDPKRPFFRSTAVTAQICHRLAREYSAAGIVIDDGTFGGGVNDILRDILGERTYPIAFGSAPTDRPVEPEDRRRKAEKHQLDSHYVNIKAEMGWHMRGGFESGFLALGNLPPHISEPLIEQCSLMEVDHDAHGRIKLVDPDEQEELPGVGEEVRRSPDHCHALMLLWWKTGQHRGKRPIFGTPDFLRNATQLGALPDRPVVAGQARHIQGPGAGVGGQAAWIQRRYRA